MLYLYCNLLLTSSVMYFICQISEEIAFYQGNKKEQAIINSALLRLVTLAFMIIILIMSLL